MRPQLSTSRFPSTLCVQLELGFPSTRVHRCSLSFSLCRHYLSPPLVLPLGLTYEISGSYSVSGSCSDRATGFREFFEIPVQRKPNSPHPGLPNSVRISLSREHPFCRHSFSRSASALRQPYVSNVVYAVRSPLLSDVRRSFRRLDTDSASIVFPPNYCSLDSVSPQTSLFFQRCYLRIQCFCYHAGLLKGTDDGDLFFGTRPRYA